jgi:hypothetical protein
MPRSCKEGFRIEVNGFSSSAFARRVVPLFVGQTQVIAESEVTPVLKALRKNGLEVLFALDSFAGGFVVQSFAAYWFYLRFGAEPATLGAIFF